MLQYSECDQAHLGLYKKTPNRVEAKDASGQTVGVIFEPTPPFLVKKEIQELLDWYHWANQATDIHVLLLLANFIFEYLAIHPFQDGNGRSSRLITNFLLLKHGYAFTRFTSHEKTIENTMAAYYSSLNQTQKTWKTEQENISPWLLYFLQTVNEQAQEALQILQGDSFEHLLSEKQLLLWSWVQAQPGSFTRKDALVDLNIPVRTIEYGLKKLLDMKKIQKLGAGRGTHYRNI